MKVCIKCQKEFADGMAFCPYCGIQLQPKVLEYSCPTCGKILGKNIPAFCPYCGQQLASSVAAKPDINATYKPVNNKPINTTDSGKSHSENPGEESSSQTSLTAFIGLCVGSLILTALMHNLILSNICLGLIPIVAFGAAKGYYQKKRTLPLIAIVVLSIITICGLLIMKSIGKEAIRNSVIPTKSGSVTQTAQTSNKETASDVLAKYSKPDMKTLQCVQKKIFANELEAEAEMLPGPERSAINATKLLSPTVDYPRIYCFNAFDTCLGRDQDYNVVITYCLIDTITYPQKDLMDYWEVQISNTFFNNKIKDYGFPKLIHKQFNKQTNEERVTEKRFLGYSKKDQSPMLITLKDYPDMVSLKVDDTNFKKRKIPWQEIKNERMRKFYEFF